ncbi:CAP domain-containing protein [uncultured Subdoligranulum sp.]|uniref:CAP domain-containing protein n=1 Tax=uncultured Subdoligranulum sp. TaxID=512298 RepID=UPI0025DB304E|nr:CAP domain-containing protein [uncultured Subdoligranulum sp.]
MKTICQRGLALLTTLALLFTWALPAFAAGETYQVQYDVTYDQTSARTMLEMVNAFRTGGDAWYWDESDTTKVQVTGLQPLTYDYELEKVAMQRAAEAAISFSHTRPNGASCWTAYDEVDGNFGYMYAENIAAGNRTAEATFEQWQETDENYEGQGHRRNMLSSDTTTFAVAHVVYQGWHFWVQEFGNNLANGTETAANDTAETVTVAVSDSRLTNVTVNTPEPLTLNVGDTAELPRAEADIAVAEAWMTKPVVEAQASWQDDANGVVQVEGNQVTALKAGTTTLTGTALGQPVTLNVTVQPASLEGATVTLDQTQFTVTGSEIRPAVTVTLDGKTLTEGTDYTVTYANNQEIGTATVTVTGTGNYTGTAQTIFTIVECTHQWDGGTVITPATCTTEGVRTYTCALCGATKDEAIPALGHAFGEWQTTKEPTCTEPGEQTRTCTRCGETETQPVAMLGHTWDAGVVTTEPFCNKEGVMTYTCTVCQATRTEPIPMKEHTPMTIPGVEPTCTVAGRSDAKICSTCGNTLEEPHAIPALGHDWGEWEEVQAPSCTASGMRRHQCKRCGFIETEDLDPTDHTWNSEPTVDKEPTCTEEGSQSIHCVNCDAAKDSQVIPALGHDWGEWQTTKEPTCTEAGEQTRTCTRCGETETQPVAALGHTWDEGVVTTEATCTAEGVMTYTCTVCHATETRPIPMKPHTPETVPGKAATCTETGLTEGSKCSVCGTVITAQQEIPALGHAWDEGVVTKAPTCTEAGEKTFTCSHCQETKTETVEALGHTPEVIPGKEPTCTETGLTEGSKCSVCGTILTEQTVIDALGHEWGEWQTTKEATCTETGEQMRTCIRCGETETQPIQATGHRYATVWSYDSATHWHACEICGDREDEAAHSWKWVVDQEPTATRPGSQHQECTVCGARGQVETLLAATVADAEPDTTHRVQIYNQVPQDSTVTEAMVHEAMGKLPYDTGYDVVNVTTFFYDLTLQCKVGEGEWTDVEPSNRAVTVTLPYPDGTNGTDYDFVVTHYRDDKTMEQPAVTETENGLQVTLQGLSPVAVTAYQLQAKEPVATPTPGTGSEGEGSPTPAPETTPAPSSEPSATTVPAVSTTAASEATATPAPTATPTPTSAPAPTQTAAPLTTIPATGDDLPLTLLVILCAVGAGGLAVLTVQARRRQ